MNKILLISISLLLSVCDRTLSQNYHQAAKVKLTDAAALMAEDSLYWGSGVISHGDTPIKSAWQTLSSGSAMADIRPLTYEDGSPLIENNKLYYSVSSRTGGAGPAILELDLGTCQVRVTGILRTSFENVMWQGMASHIMYNRKTGIWQVTIPLHKTDPATGKWTHLLAVQKSYSDLRFGATRLDFELLDYEQPTVGDEDAQIFYDEGMKCWVMIYASTRQPDGKRGSYILRLQTSNRPDGGFKDYSYATGVNSTGVTSSVVGGKRYVFSGDLQTDGHNNYPVFSFPDLKKVGQLNIDITDGGTRGWNNVTPFAEGMNTRYVFLAFDRGVTTDENVWTYGRLHLYYSKERNPGLEFDMRQGDVTVPASIKPLYGPTDLHFVRHATWNNLFEHDIRMGVIDLSDQVHNIGNSNMYPTFGYAKLQQKGNELYPVTAGDVGVISGVHLPLCNYILSLENIAKDESRYLYLGDKTGHAFMKVVFTQRADGDISISYVDREGTEKEIGHVAQSQQKKTKPTSLEARIFITPESILYVYTRDVTK